MPDSVPVFVLSVVINTPLYKACLMPVSLNNHSRDGRIFLVAHSVCISLMDWSRQGKCYTFLACTGIATECLNSRLL